MRWFAALFASVLALNVQAQGLILNVTLDYDQERDHVATQSVFNDLARYLSGALGQPVKLIMTQNAERVGERIRTGTYSMLLAPAQLVGAAMRNGYLPVAKTQEDARVVLLARKASGVKSLESARGKRIVLPHSESLVSYIIKGELNALGYAPSRYFGQVTHVNKYGAVLYALEIGQADLVAVKEGAARDWVAKHPDTAIIKTFTAVPTAGVVASGKLDEAQRDRIRAAFTGIDPGLEARMKRAMLGVFEPADKVDFEFVSTRGFYTPEVLAGAEIVTAEQVKRLMGQGAALYDVRPLAHYREAHIPGAIHLPYQMKSPKEVDYDDAVDSFDLKRLPQDLHAAMIFQCNGAECWYSYKAARYLVKRGYKKVYWFRTGLPAWKAAGYGVQHGS